MTKALYSIKSFEKRRRRPLKAFKHFRKLIANKEDTTQVFYVIEALNGNSFQKRFVKFANSEKGQKRLKENRYLTAQGLVDEYDRSNINRDFGHPEMNIYGDRSRDTHDMLHVLTGFGRDALGEASVLGFSHAQHGGLGILFIAYGAALEVRKTAPKGAPVLKSIHEARKIGKAAQDIVYEDIMELLPLPLDIVREKLGITLLPTHYHAVHAKMRENGIDPYGVIGADPVAA